MNIFLNGEHPSEEELMELAVSDASTEIKEHIVNCPLCTRTVKEFREVGKQVSSFEDEDVPLQTEQRIMNIMMHHGHHVHPGGPFSSLQTLFTNPFLIALFVAIVVIFLYFLVGSEVFKSP